MCTNESFGVARLNKKASVTLFRKRQNLMFFTSLLMKSVHFVVPQRGDPEVGSCVCVHVCEGLSPAGTYCNGQDVSSACPCHTNRA